MTGTPDTAKALTSELRNDEREELRKLREYHSAVEQLVCVWAGTDRPSSFSPSRRDECEDDDDLDVWDRFIAARSALGEK